MSLFDQHGLFFLPSSFLPLLPLVLTLLSVTALKERRVKTYRAGYGAATGGRRVKKRQRVDDRL
jgi:hypothetical protein